MTRTSSTLWRTATLSVGITLAASSIAAAQTPVSVTIPSFARQIEGRSVWITADGARVRGVVASLKTEGLVLFEDGVATTIAYDKVVRVEKSTHRLRKGTLIGLASGAGLGLVFGGLYCGGDEYCEPGAVAGLTAYYAGLGAAAGVGIGAIVNASKKNTDVLYDSRRSTRTMSLAPILSPTRKGMAFSMTWR